MVNTEVKIDVVWNEESEAWLATSEEVPGLVAESRSYQELVEIVKDLLPDLLPDRSEWDDIPYQLISHHHTNHSRI